MKKVVCNFLLVVSSFGAASALQASALAQPVKSIKLVAETVTSTPHQNMSKNDTVSNDAKNNRREHREHRRERRERRERRHW